MSRVWLGLSGRVLEPAGLAATPDGGPRLRASLRLLVVPAVLGTAITAAARGPELLRRMETFRVTQVELLGARYLEPRHILDASGITVDANLFDDTQPWREALVAHPLVDEARIARRPPGTLVIHVVEAELVALVRTPELRPVTAAGAVVPREMQAEIPDLPVLNTLAEVGDDGRISDAEALAALATLDRVRRLDPDLVAGTSEIVPLARGAVRLRLHEPSRLDVLVAHDIDAVGIRQLRSTMADLAARGALDGVRALDARFRDQIVVSLNPNA